MLSFQIKFQSGVGCSGKIYKTGKERGGVSHIKGGTAYISGADFLHNMILENTFNPTFNG